MTENPTRGKSPKSLGDTTVITLAGVEEPETHTTLNFRVPVEFHLDFKLYAVQHGMSMVDLLQESFRVMKAHHKR